jgi:hypothetical protein
VVSIALLRSNLPPHAEYSLPLRKLGDDFEVAASMGSDHSSIVVHTAKRTCFSITVTLVTVLPAGVAGDIYFARGYRSQCRTGSTGRELFLLRAGAEAIGGCRTRRDRLQESASIHGNSPFVS